MDFLDPNKKRHHSTRLIVGYILIAVIIAGLSYLLLLQSFGYDYDRKTGQIIQNGLIYVSSHPVSADVYVNNQLKGNTNLKLTIPSGNYNFILKSQSYRNWYATVNLDGGGVVRLTYPLLVPQKLVTTDVQLYAKSPGLISASTDRHWLLVLQPESMTKFDVYDMSQSEPVARVINLPAKLVKSATGTQTMKVIEWASDNQHVLIEHAYKDGKEFIVVDRQNPNQSFNVNSLLTVAPDSVSLHGKRFDRIYAYIAKTKSLLDINAGSKQINTILKAVASYKAFGNNSILYTSTDSKFAGQYSVNIWDGQKSYLLHNYPAKTDYKLNAASYAGQTYIAVAPVKANKLYVFKNPLGIMKAGKVPNPFIAIKINNPQFVSFPTNGQFVMAQSGSSFAAYDFDTGLWHYFTLKDKIPLTSQAVWMDNFHLTININNKFNVFDFNGGNQQALSAGLASTNGWFDAKFAHFYSIASSTEVPGRPALTSTQMIVP